ncbi:hypothetical protein A2U01_0074624, partial [Trifolium medium]|nr:hypothetical protein [Trifolium medium]
NFLVFLALLPTAPSLGRAKPGAKGSPVTLELLVDAPSLGNSKPGAIHCSQG